MVKPVLPCVLAAFAFTLAAGPALADGDPAEGKKVFRKCMVCHSVKPGQHKIGPSLHGVVGSKAGTAEGFRYSRAMKKADFTWNEKTLDEYLENPRKMVRGTRMAFAGLRSEKDRADVIAYLKTLK